MVKLIRKKKQWFMVVFGGLLLLTFLFTGSSSIFTPDPMKRTVATVSGGKVSMGEAEHAQREYELLRDLAPGTFLGALGVESGTHWMLLVREAERAGLVGSSGDGADWLAGELPESEAMIGLEMQYRQLGPEMLRQVLSMPSMTEPAIANVRERFQRARPQLSGKARLTEEAFDVVIAKARGVARLVNSYHRAARVSDRQVMIEARRMGDAVMVDVLLIPADRLEADAPPPSDADVQAHYEKYREVEPGQGERGFGYVQPPRVKFEYIMLDRAAISNALVLDPIAVNKFYQQHRADYPGEFAAEKPKIETRLREDATQDMLRQWDSVYKARVKAAGRSLASEGANRVLPEDWATRMPRMEALARDVTDAVSTASGVRLPLPTVVVRGNQWTRVDQAGTVPGLGQATLTVAGQNRANFQQVLGALHEFLPQSTLGFQARYPFDQYLESSGNRYYISVLEAKGTSPPESLDEVRAEVVRDLRLNWAYEQLASQASEFRGQAISESLGAVGQRFARPAVADVQGTEGVSPVTGVRVSREFAGDSRAPQINVPTVRDTVMGAAESMGFLAAPTPANLDARTFAFPLPAALSVAVLQITHPAPVTVEDLRTLTRAGYQAVLRQEVNAADPEAGNPFSEANMKARLEYRPAVEESGEASSPA